MISIEKLPASPCLRVSPSSTRFNSHLAPLSVNPKTRPELKLRANSLSPLKWTKTLVQSSLDDFSYERCGFNHWRLLQGVQDLSSTSSLLERLIIVMRHEDRKPTNLITYPCFKDTAISS